MWSVLLGIAIGIRDRFSIPKCRDYERPNPWISGCKTFIRFWNRAKNYEPGSVDIDSHKLSSWKVVHQCVLTCSHRWTTFQLLSLWLSVSTGLWPQTTHASHVCRQVAPVGSNRFHNFYVSHIYRAYVTTMSSQLCRVVKRPLQSLLSAGSTWIPRDVACVF